MNPFVLDEKMREAVENTVHLVHETLIELSKKKKHLIEEIDNLLAQLPTKPIQETIPVDTIYTNL